MRWIAPLAAVPLLALGGPGTAAAQPAAHEVQMKDFAFMPVKVTIKAGETVTWTYKEEPTDPAGCENPLLQLPGSPVTCPGHSATAVDKGPDGKPLFDSGLHRANGFPYSFTFTKPGTYHYYCVVHGGSAKNNPITNMEGDIVVEAAAAQTPATTPTTAAPTTTTTASRPATQVAGEQLANTGGGVPLALGVGALAAAFLLGRRNRR